MTNPTPHGQVPEALIDLIDAYAETRHRCGGIYNARTEAARNAVIEALSGVQALSAAPGVTSEQRRLIGVIADKIEDGTLFQSGIYLKKDLARFVRNMLDTTPTAPAASPTPPAEQQAAPKAAPARTALPEGWTDCTIEFGNDGSEVVAYGPKRMMNRLAKWLGKYFAQVIADAAHKAAPGEPVWWRKHADEIEAQVALTGSPEAMRCYTDMWTLLQAAAEAAPQQEAQEPVVIKAMGYGGSTGVNDYLMSDGTIKAMRPSEVVWAAPQPAPAPPSDDVVKDAARYRWLRDSGNGRPLSVGRFISLCDEHPRYEEVDWLYDDDLDAAIDAALAAQKGTP